MSTFRVYHDPDTINKHFSELSPFNLKQDLKGISKDTISNISEEIANELYNGINRPPNIIPLYWGKNRDAACAKIRAIDVARDAGKSHGYRCITLVDMVHKSAFLLHIYRHGHGENENISKRDKNALKRLVNKYVESLEKMNNLSDTGK